MFGLHVSKEDFSGKKCKTIGEAIDNTINEFEIGAAQIFTHGPQNSKKNNVILSKANIEIFVHSSYLCVGVWKNPKMRFLLESELTTAESVGARGLVVHLQSVPPEQVAAVCQEVHKKINFKVPLLLETPAIKSTAENHYSKPETLKILSSLLKDSKFDWGLCVDTSHLWASGVDISTAEAAEKWLSIAPHEKIKLFHINSNHSRNFATGKDFHIIPLSAEDGIWGKFLGPSIVNNFNWAKVTKEDKDLLMSSGLAAFIKFAKKNNIPCISEVNRGESSSLELYRLLFSVF